MKTMSHSNQPRDNFLLLLLLLLLLLFLFLLLLLLLLLVKRMFSSLLRVVAIRFSHRKQWLIVISVNIVSSASLHLNQIFYFHLYLYIKKVILLLNTNNLYKLQTFFFVNQSHIAINLLTGLPWWPSHSPDIRANSVSNILHFLERQLYCQYVVENAFVLDILKV